jgi:hypothetical protein
VSAAPARLRLDRAALARLLGEPTDQEGSVNDPRTRLEGGLRWNEKWSYRSRRGGGIERVVLWYRYDLVGVFRVEPDGALVPEELSAG